MNPLLLRKVLFAGLGIAGGITAIWATQADSSPFRGKYSGEMNSQNAGVEAFPDSHIGTGASSAKNWIQEMAVGSRYDRVVWASAGKD